MEFGNGAPKLSIQAGVHGSWSIISPTPDSGVLFDPDKFGDNLKIPKGTCYVAAELNALLGSPEKLRSAKAAALLAAEKTFCWERQAPILLESINASFRRKAADHPIQR